jgi:hypothetical protein
MIGEFLNISRLTLMFTAEYLLALVLDERWRTWGEDGSEIHNCSTQSWKGGDGDGADSISMVKCYRDKSVPETSCQSNYFRDCPQPSEVSGVGTRH